MAELRAGRSWRWFTVRLSHLSPGSAFWRWWGARDDDGGGGDGGRPVLNGRRDGGRVKTVDSPGEFRAWASSMFKAADGG